MVRPTVSRVSQLDLVTMDDVQRIKGVFFPAGMKFRQLIVTGPPGSGKTRMINKIGGWPEEGFIDLTLKGWWRAQPLSLRPREVNLGLPFVGCKEPLTVFDQDFLAPPEPLEVDLDCILLPPQKTHILSTDWRRRFMFEFAIPAPEQILEWRLARRRKESHPIDENVSMDQVMRQVAVFETVARHFHRNQILIYVRDEIEGMPKTDLAKSAVFWVAEIFI